MIIIVKDDTYFSERELGLPSQNIDEIGQQFWEGFVALIINNINNGSLAEEFPKMCDDPDKPLPIGSNAELVYVTLKAVIPSAISSSERTLSQYVLPDTLSALDIVEFFYRHVSKPTQKEYHSFYNHNHLRSFDRDSGQREYLESVNLLFRRNNLAYELKANRKVERLGPIILRDILTSATFRTGDQELNRLLEDARIKIGDPDLNIRRDAVEKLWDAWERLKTLEPGSNKKQQINALLTRSIPQADLRTTIEEEAQALTNLGNNFRIRHSETNKPIISDAESVDYLFYRLFALIQLLLKKTNRGG